MALNEQEVEDEINAKGLNKFKRLTPADIEALIRETNYWQVPGTTAVVCALTLQNGFIVTGMSSPISPGNFDEELGKKIAYSNARAAIWPLAGYHERCKLEQR